MRGFLMVAVLASTGCVRQPAADVVKPQPGAVIDHGVTRVDDKERGVACYVYSGYKKGGISCLRADSE